MKKFIYILFSFLNLWLFIFGCEDKPSVKFFVDINSKAPQPGYTVQFIFVIWNEGRVTAKNVILTDPMLQLEPYEHLSHVTYIKGSMSINREYHPNTSKESYFFVPRQPLTDDNDSDEGTYDENSNTVFFKMKEMEPNDYVVWAFMVKINEDAPCASNPYIQNVATITADNGNPYENDIIGHIVCESPKLRAQKTANLTEVRSGEYIDYTIEYSLDYLEIPGIDPSRFDIRRVRIFDNFPAEFLEISSIDNGGEEKNGAIFWQVDSLKNGGSGSVKWRAKVKSQIPPATSIVNNVEITSQNTVQEQNMGSSFTITVISP